MPGIEGKWPGFDNYANRAEDTGRFIGRNAGLTEHRVGTVSDPAMWRFEFGPRPWPERARADLDSGSCLFFGSHI